MTDEEKSLIAQAQSRALADVPKPRAPLPPRRPAHPTDPIHDWAAGRKTLEATPAQKDAWQDFYWFVHGPNVVEENRNRRLRALSVLRAQIVAADQRGESVDEIARTMRLPAARTYEFFGGQGWDEMQVPPDYIREVLKEAHAQIREGKR